MPITPTALNAIMNLLALMLLLTLERDLPTTLQVFKTQADDKSISIYDSGGLPILLIPKAQITMQGIQVPCLSTSTFYHG